jgi:hypothetical protein
MIKTIEEYAIQTAYMWTRLNDYGSESKAIQSLISRKGIKDISQEKAKSFIQLGVNILDLTDKLIKEEVDKQGKRDLSLFSNDEIEYSTNLIREELLAVYPDSKEMVEYAISMLVIMPHMR